MEHTTNNP